MLDSKKVRLGDLGTFYLSAETEPGDTAEEFTDNNVKKVHLRFLPSKKQSYPLDSVSMRSKASFTDLATLVGKAEGSDSEE